ncbi:MAG: cytochrome P450, partial [Actinomycetes bacterium]
MDTSIRSRAGLLDPDFYVDFDAMHEELAWMRAEDPVHRDEASGVWAITRHADVVDVERRDQVFVSSRGYRSFLAPGEDNMIALDDPAHVHQR